MLSTTPKDFIKSAIDRAQALGAKAPTAFKAEAPKNVKPPRQIKLLKGAQRVLAGRGPGLGRI